MGQRLIDTVAKSIINQAFETLDNALVEQVNAETEGRDVAYEKSSESDYVATVAKDLIKNVLKGKGSEES